MAGEHPTYEKSVFINCPFDERYAPLFDAIVFTVKILGFEPRSSREMDDGDVRINKILNLIGQCRYGIHDISRTQLDRKTRTPRFNMPFELGLDLGCKRFGEPRHRRKILVVLDIKEHRFHVFLSDLSGQDPKGHKNSPNKVIELVRDWLAIANRRRHFPSSDRLQRQYAAFRRKLPVLCKPHQLNPKRLSFLEYADMVNAWGDELLVRAKQLDKKAAGKKRSRTNTIARHRKI